MCSTACLLHQRHQHGIMFFKSAHSSQRTLRSGHCQASDSDTLVIVAHNNIILQLGFWMCVPACFGPTQHLQTQGICLCVLLSGKLEKQAASVGSPASRRIANEVLQVCQSNELLRHRKCGAVHPEHSLLRVLEGLDSFPSPPCFDYSSGCQLPRYQEGWNSMS